MLQQPLLVANEHFRGCERCSTAHHQKAMFVCEVLKCVSLHTHATAGFVSVTKMSFGQCLPNLWYFCVVSNMYEGLREPPVQLTLV